MNSNKTMAKLILIAFALALGLLATEAKLFGRSRYYEDSMDPYYPSASGRTGERAILTVRGARNPYDGSAPGKMIIQDNPYRGPFPRGVYDRVDPSYDRGYGRYPSTYPDQFG